MADWSKDDLVDEVLRHLRDGAERALIRVSAEDEALLRAGLSKMNNRELWALERATHDATVVDLPKRGERPALVAVKEDVENG